MAFELAGLRAVSSGENALAEPSPRQRAELQVHLLRALEHSHGRVLTDAQRHEMAQSLADQMAASDVLRRYSLGNDDAPCFLKAPFRRGVDD